MGTPARLHTALDTAQLNESCTLRVALIRSSAYGNKDGVVHVLWFDAAVIAPHAENSVQLSDA
jgi:hypothetical protein